MGLGGSAEYFFRAQSDDDALGAIDYALSAKIPLTVFGGGSNVVVHERGVRGLVLCLDTQNVAIHDDNVVEVAAGKNWHTFVQEMCAKGLFGIECLAGIPGRVGATPIQNVGAYGQEVSDVIERVKVYDRQKKCVRTLTNSACAFAYRDSVFRRNPEAFIVLSITFYLSPRAPAIKYEQLRAALADDGDNIHRRIEEVIALRKQKSMVVNYCENATYDPTRPTNQFSAGSFFKNPVISPQAWPAFSKQFTSPVPHYDIVAAKPRRRSMEKGPRGLADRTGWF